MGEENRSLLEEEIKAEIKRLGSLESGSQEHTTAVDSLTKLYKLKLEEDKNPYERLDKIENREIDQESKTAQMAESVKDRYFRYGMAAAELVLPLMVLRRLDETRSQVRTGRNFHLPDIQRFIQSIQTD